MSLCLCRSTPHGVLADAHRQPGRATPTLELPATRHDLTWFLPGCYVRHTRTIQLSPRVSPSGGWNPSTPIPCRPRPAAAPGRGFGNSGPAVASSAIESEPSISALRMPKWQKRTIDKEDGCRSEALDPHAYQTRIVSLEGNRDMQFSVSPARKSIARIPAPA